MHRSIQVRFSKLSRLQRIIIEFDNVECKIPSKLNKPYTHEYIAKFSIDPFLAYTIYNLHTYIIAT